MPERDLIIDFSEFDPQRVIATIDDIRRYNRQRFEMEQLSGILLEDPVRRICVGFRDVRLDEFWVRGHMPGVPVLPGVLMCEAAAQLSSYAAAKYNLFDTELIGLGGMDEVRFREPVLPGDKLILVAQVLKHRQGILVVCRFQGFVQQNLVCEGQIRGVRLPKERLASATERL